MSNLYHKSIEEIEKYTKNIIPKLEKALSSDILEPSKRVELVKAYRQALVNIAPNDFISFNKVIEFFEDKNNEGKNFYGNRQNALGDLFNALNDMEIYDKYDTLIVCMPPRVGKTTTGIRFLAWIIGRHPEFTQMATSYADSVTRSFYNGVIEIVQSSEFNECFPESPLVGQNAKLEQISLRSIQRYPSILFVPIDGSMTGRGEASKYMYCDDLVSGIEEATNQDRLNKLWEKYTVNVKQRKKKGCKEIHVATPWSVHDVITKVRDLNSNNDRCKIIKLPCYDKHGKSNFDYLGGFDTKYYKELEETMDELSFKALYMQEPVEREGILYHEDELRYYIDLPKETPDGIFAVCDSKNLGSDSVSCPIAYVFGDDVYIEDVVFNNGLPDVTIPTVAEKLYQHNVKICDFEINNGGNHFATEVDRVIKEKYCGDTRVRMFNTTSNKIVKIITYSNFVKKNFYFKDKSCYKPNSDYYKFMKELLKFSQTGKNAHDDAPDSIAMLAEMLEGFKLGQVKILNRRELKI